MTLEEFEKKVSKKRSIPLEYRNFEEWEVKQFDWNRGVLFMVPGEDSSIGTEKEIEIGFIRDDGFLTENCWDFYIIRNPLIMGFGMDELKFFATILDILMDCEDNYDGKNG